MNHQRPYEIDTENIRQAGTPNVVRDLLRGLVADTRGLLEGRQMRRRATDAKQKAIADEAYRQRMASLQERQVQIQERRAELASTKYEDDKKAAAAKAELDEEQREIDKRAKEDYSTAFAEYEEAYTAWLKDPSPENENMLRSASNRFQFYARQIDVDTQYVAENLKTIEQRGKEHETQQTEADLDTLTDTFNQAFSTFNNMTPDDEGYADAYTTLLRAASALNRAQETLQIDDPLVENILKDPKSMGKIDKLNTLEERQPEATQAFWQAYQAYTTDPEATLQDVEQRGADLINLLTQLGEDPSTYTNILQNLRQQNTERIKAKRDVEDAANERLDATNIEQIKNTIKAATYLDADEKAFINDALDAGIFETREDVNKHLSTLQTQKARARYTGTDASKAIGKVDKYDATGANRRLINAVAANQTKDRRQFNIDYLDDVFEDNEFPELAEKQKDAAALFFLQNDKAPGGEIVTRFMQATTFLQNGLASLYQEYNRLTKDGTQVKHKLGRLVKVREGVYRHVAGDITDPDVAAFDAKVGYLLTTYIRMVSGAQVPIYEESKFKKMLVSAGNTVDLNDAIFKALDDEIRGQLQGYFSRRVGREWGEAIGDKVYHDAHDIAADVAAKTDSRIGNAAPEQMQWSQATDETKLRDTIDGLKGIDSETGETFEKMTRDELRQFMREVGATEQEADRLLDEAEAAIAAEEIE